MFACLHGPGNLTALAFEFSPVVEATSPDTVTFDVDGQVVVVVAVTIGVRIGGRARVTRGACIWDQRNLERCEGK